MEAVHQSLYRQLSSISIRPIEMMSENSETATIVFIFERALRGYISHPNRSPDEGDMPILRKPRVAEKCHPGGWIWRTKSTRLGGLPKAQRRQQSPPERVALGRLGYPGGWPPEGTVEATTSTWAGSSWTAKPPGRVARAEVRFCGPFLEFLA